jgi:hypothetical protein
VSGGDLSPQVIKRGDEYVIHNMDLSQYTRLQKVGVAMLVWDQVRMLMEAAGLYMARDKHNMRSVGIGHTRDIDFVVADMLGISRAGVTQIRPRLHKRPDVIEKIMSGEITSHHDVPRAVGMKLRSRLDEGAESTAKRTNSYYGKGDKFDEALEPLLRYLAAWRKREFKYSHVPPRAAQKRIAVLDEVVTDLVNAREDLKTRSHVATLGVPSERKRRERS